MHLFSTDPTSGGMEIGGGGYLPFEIDNNSAHWPDAMGGLKTNGIAENFAISTGPWSAPANFFWLSDSEFQLLPPMSPSVANVGTVGVTNAQYVVTVLNAKGESTPSGIGVTTTGNANLTGSNYNAVSWDAVTGATGYNIYKLVAGTFVFLGTTASTSFHDTGQATASQVPPVSNTTMTLLDGGPLATPIRVLDAGYIVSFPPQSIVIGD